MPPEEDLDSYWETFRPKGATVSILRNDLPSILELAQEKTAADLQAWMTRNPGVLDISAMVSKGVGFFWTHLTTDLKRIDTVGLIEIILSVQGLPAAEMKSFVRALPRSLLERIVSSDLGATAGGIHALLSLEILFRDGRESDYQLTTVPSGGIELTVHPRNRAGEVVRFRLDESFSLQPAHAEPTNVPESELF